MTLRPLWRTAAASFAKPEIVQVPASHRLWYDDRDVEFLKEDRKDSSEILQQQATTIRQLVDAGYSPDAVIDAVKPTTCPGSPASTPGCSASSCSPPAPHLPRRLHLVARSSCPSTRPTEGGPRCRRRLSPASRVKDATLGIIEAVFASHLVDRADLAKAAADVIDKDGDVTLKGRSPPASPW